MNLCFLLEEDLFCFIEGDRSSEVDGLVEGDFLFVGAVPAGFGRMFLIVGFPLNEEKTRKFDVGGTLLKMGLEGDVVEFSIDLIVHVGLFMFRYLLIKSVGTNYCL